MAVVGAAIQIGEGRGGEDLEAGLKRFFQTYLVRTSNPYDATEVVLGAGGLPAKGDPYSSHPTAIVVARYPRPIDGTRLIWHVEVEYSTHSIDRDENPLNTRPEIEWGFEPYDEPLPGTAKPGYTFTYQAQDDVNGETTPVRAEGFFFGKGVVNAAGDPFDPPPTRLNYYPVVRFMRNEATFTPTFAIQYGNTVNRSIWNGLYPRQVWLKPIEATHQVHSPDGLDKPEILYWRVRYTFVLKFWTWDLFVLNQGYRYLNKANTNADAVKIPFLKDGHPSIDLLKEDGTRFGTTEEKKPSWIPVPGYRAMDFTPLNIRLDLALNDLRRIRR